MLVVAQIAFTLLILVAAGLFVRTLSNLQSIELGFNRENLLTFQLNARRPDTTDPEIVAFYNDLRTRSARSPACAARRSRTCRRSESGTSGTGVSVSGGRARRHQHPDHRGRVLHHDADSAAARPRDRRARPARLAHRRGRERGVRQTKLRRSESARSAPGPRAQVHRSATSRSSASRRIPSMGISRGRRRPRSICRSRRTSGGPCRRWSTSCGRRRIRSPTSTPCARSVQRADPRVPLADVKTQTRAHRPDHQSGDHVCPAVHRVCAAGTGDRVRRPLRHDVVQRRPPDRRDRHPDGARSAARPGRLDGAARGAVLLAAVGLAIGVPAALGGVEAGGIVSLRHEAERSAGLDRVGGDPGERRDSGRLPAGADMRLESIR